MKENKKSSKMPSASNPMQQAVFRGCVECIRMLVENPPYYSVDSCCGPDGLRPIHIAAREGHIQTLRYLSAAGACLQRSDYSGCTALHHSAITGQLRAVRWLLRHGAKILLDKCGRSPIQVAADHDHFEIVSVLAKHATVTNGATLTTCSNNKDKETTVKSATHHNSKASSDSHNHRTSKRSQSEERSLKDKSIGDNQTECTIDEDYSITSQCQTTPHTNTYDPKPFSHLHLSESEASKSPGDCASSSGNSSLTASTSAPSLSPSASSSSAASCSCSTSDETTLLKSIVEVSDSFTLEEYNSKSSISTEQSRNSISSQQSQAPFFLHPPKEKENVLDTTDHIFDFNTNDNIISAGDKKINSNTNGVSTKKKSNHKRQQSTTLSSPFFLHPPENLVSETQRVVGSKMAPVNPSHTLHHFADTINEPPKLKVSLPGDSSPSDSSSSSPPLSSPNRKSPLSPSELSNGFSKFQPPLSPKKSESPANNKSLSHQNKYQINSDSSNADVKIKNHINNNFEPPPPPPPPPLPKSNPQNSNHNHNMPNGNHFSKESDQNRNISHYPYNDKDESSQAENDYEDIEELTNGTNHYEHARKLLRSVSAPPVNNNDHSNSNVEDKVQPAVPERTLVMPNKSPMGCGKPGVPFIPPHFPTPPHDALIKPSEYLRSIQNKPKSNGTHSNGSSLARSSSFRVEEAFKALGVQDNHTGLMSPLPEETNAEDEFEEINPERINGCGKLNGHENGNFEVSNHYRNSNGTDENNNSNNKVGSGGCGMIKAEELLKVHLRKTPMSRTKSAPPLGRVIPDDPKDTIQSQNSSQENGHEVLRRTNTSMNVNGEIGSRDGGGASEGNVTKAAVIAELAQSSQVGGVREWKEELRRRMKEQEKAVQKEIEQFYQPVNFVAEVPAMDVTGAPIPDWKRQMMAKKAAERAKKEAEEQRRLEIEAKRMASIPMWRRQLLQRRESDGKYAQ